MLAFLHASQLSNITPRITRRPKPLREFNSARVGGRVHALVRPRCGLRLRGARPAHDPPTAPRSAESHHAPHATRNPFFRETRPKTFSSRLRQKSGLTPRITRPPASLNGFEIPRVAGRVHALVR